MLSEETPKREESLTEIVLSDNPEAPSQHTSQFMIDLKDIKVKVDRGRKDFGDIIGLVASIKAVGLMQPLVIREIPQSPGQWDLIAGERRYRALMFAGETRAPCRPYCQDVDDHTAKIMELEENIRRRNLDWSERVFIMEQIHALQTEKHGYRTKGHETKEGWGYMDTAKVTGDSVAWTQQQISLAKDMTDRPEIAEKIKSLPIKAAMREMKKHKEEEKVTEDIKAGKITITSELTLGDNVKLMRGLEDNSIDLVLTDPPFGLDELELPTDRGQVQSFMQLLKPTDNLTGLTAKAAIRKIHADMIRVLKPSAHFYIFCKWNLVPDIMFDLKGNLDSPKLLVYNPIIWDKGRPTAPFRGYSYAPSYEVIIHGCKPPQERRLAQACRDIISFKPLSATAKRHPFQKPPELLWYLIKQSTSEGDVVLDPFAGSGSTLMACRDTKRRGLGFEVDEGHYKLALNWLNEKKGD
jgi:site-specific DNA-methyltransferase (adenine-specific)